MLKLSQQHIMDIKTILNEVGLTGNEAVIYLTSLQIGEQPASIIAKRANLNRGTTYSVLKTLIDKGLIFQSKKALGTYFQAKDPGYIINFLDEKKNLIDQKKEFLSNHLEEIIKTKSSIENSKPQTTFYEGIDGIKQIHEDILTSETGTTIYSFIPQDMVEGELESFVLKNFVKRRAEKRIYAKVIAPDCIKNQELKENDKKFLRETKIVPQDKYNFESEITIYQEKIALVSYKKEEKMGLIVESPSISKTLKQIFDLTWNLGTEFIPAQDKMF